MLNSKQQISVMVNTLEYAFPGNLHQLMQKQRWCSGHLFYMLYWESLPFQ